MKTVKTTKMKTAKTTRLSERAMLVHLRCSMWTGRKKNKRISEDVCAKSKAAADAGGWWTYLLPKSEVNAMVNAAWKVQARHLHYTYPWLDGGMRILPSCRFLQYRQDMTKAIGEYEAAIDAFVQRYPSIVAKSPERLGNLNAAMPSATEIRGKFAMSHSIFPIPETDDFRVHMTDDEKNEVKTKVNDSINASLAVAVAAVWDKLTKAVEKIAEAMKDKDKRFKNVLFTNLSQICDELPQLNFTNDPKLDEMRKHIQAMLAEFKPDEVRDDVVKRQAASKAAKDVLEKMKDYTM